MNLTFSKKNDFKKILTKSKPGLFRLAKELYIEDISDDYTKVVNKPKSKEIDKEYMEEMFGNIELENVSN